MSDTTPKAAALAALGGHEAALPALQSAEAEALAALRDAEGRHNEAAHAVYLHRLERERLRAAWLAARD